MVRAFLLSWIRSFGADRARKIVSEKLARCQNGKVNRDRGRRRIFADGYGLIVGRREASIRLSLWNRLHDCDTRRTNSLVDKQPHRDSRGEPSRCPLSRSSSKQRCLSRQHRVDTGIPESNWSRGSLTIIPIASALIRIIHPRIYSPRLCP